MQSLILSNPSDSNQRLDRFLKKYFPNSPLSAIYKMLRTGKIKVNGKKKSETYKLEEGDELTFWISDEEIDALRSTKTVVIEPTLGIRPTLEILYEDEYLMVINKPPKMNVHPGDHKTSEVSLIELVQDTLGGRYDSLTFKPSLVHRIDRDTSGCILIAKEKRTLEGLLLSLQSGKIEKVYHTLVSGTFIEKSGTFRDKLERIENAKNEAKVRVSDIGQLAVTHYKILRSGDLKLPQTEDKNAKNTISLLECRIETGRTHQIRVHLSYHNCPIIGDKSYGDKKINAYLAKEVKIDRQLLHAKKLEFPHPITKKRLIVEAPYPEDFERLISSVLFEYPGV